MANRPHTIEQTLTLLAAAPERLAAATAGLTPARLCTPPAPDEWSIRDVLAHLRACADVWGGCITTILAQERPTIRAMDPRTWSQKTDYGAQEFEPSFRAYCAQRADLLAVLKPLPPEDWQRPATVTGAGKTLERTVLSYAGWLATHERSHLKHIERMVKSPPNRPEADKRR